MANDQSKDSEDLDLLKKLDAVGEAFESAWNSNGEIASVEAFLGKHADLPADRLAQELVELEIEFRLKAGESLRTEEYAARFSDLDENWLAKLIDSKSAQALVLPERSDSGDTIPPKTTPAEVGDFERPTLAPGSRPASTKSPAKFASFGDYEIIDEIARGGMGVVYKARQKSLNRIVAVKMILSGQLAGEEEVQRFRSEAESAANLDHPGIVPIYEIGEHDGHQYFSMGFVEGESLQAKLIDGPLPPMEAAEITRKIAEAIAYAHDKGVIHRDLKPANVLIDKNGEARVTDFGLAKQLGGDSDLTGTGQILGTPSFMPPEQAAGQTSNVDERADVWALGAILYTLITGRPPFQAATPLDTLMQVIEKEPVRPRALDAKVPVDLETITLKCLEKEPEKRYQDSHELISELKRYANGEPIVARPIGRPARLWRWCKRKPMTATALSAASLLIVVLPIALSIMWVQQKQIAKNATELADERAKGEMVAKQNAEDLEKTLVRSNFFASKFRWLEDDPDDAISILNQIPEKYRDFNWNFLMRSYVGSVSLPGFEDIFSFNPACPRAISLSGGNLKLWNWTSGQTITVLEGVQGKPLRAAFSRDGKHLGVHVVDPKQLEITEGPSDLLPQEVPVFQVFDGQTGKLIHTELGWASRDVSLYAGPDESQISFVNSNKQLFVYETGVSKLREQFKGKRLPGTFIFNSNGDRLATFNDKNRKVEVWETSSGKILGEYPNDSDVSIPNNGVIAFSPDESNLFVGGAKEIWMIDLLSGQVQHREEWRVGQCAYCPDGSKIAISLLDQETIEVRDSNTLKLLQRFRGPTAAGKLSFSDDGAFVYTISKGLLNAWELGKEDVARVFVPPSKSLHALDIHPDGLLVASSHGDWLFPASAKKLGTIIIWNPATLDHVQRLEGHSGEVASLSFNDDGSLLASGACDKSVIIWNTTTWTPVQKLVGLGSAVQSIAFSANGECLATGLLNGEIVLWNPISGEKSHALRGHNKKISSLAFSKDGSRLVSGSFDQSIICWDVVSGKIKQKIDLPLSNFVSGINSISLDSSDQFVACGVTHDAFVVPTSIPVYDLDSGELVQTLKGHAQGVSSVSFSQSGRILASGSDDRTIKIWDIKTGEERHALEIGSIVTHVKFSACGQFLASGSFDQKVRLWDARKVWELRRDDSESDNESPSLYELALRKNAFQVRYAWHENQASEFRSKANTYAETFHRAWLKKLKPERADLHDELLVAYESLRVAYKKKPLAPSVVVPQIVKEMLAEKRGEKFTLDFAERVNGDIWAKVSVPGASAAVDEIADMENICEQHSFGYFFNTLAVCYFRSGRYELAVKAAEVSAKKMPPELGLPGEHPIDLSILAMSCFRLGQIEKAKKYRLQLKAAMKHADFQDEESKAFARETQELFKNEN